MSQRLRDQGRFAGSPYEGQGALTAELTIEELMEIITIDYPGQQPPGTTVNVRVRMKNHALYIGPFDPNRCQRGRFNLGAVGFAVRVTLRSNGVFQGDLVDCVSATPVDFVIPLQLPDQEGMHTFTIVAETDHTDEVFHTSQETIEVTSDAQPQSCIADNECPPGQVCSEGRCVDDSGGALLPCFIDPNRSCHTSEVVAWSVLAGVGAIALISTTS